MKKNGIQAALDSMVIKWIAQTCKESVKRGDSEAAMSAFCSEIARGDARYLAYFPYLKPEKAVARQRAPRDQ